MKKSLFTYAVLLHSFDKEGEYEDTKVIIEPKTILAKTEQDVAFKVTREIPEEHAKNPENVQILIKAF